MIHQAATFFGAALFFGGFIAFALIFTGLWFWWSRAMYRRGEFQAVGDWSWVILFIPLASSIFSFLCVVLYDRA